MAMTMREFVRHARIGIGFNQESRNPYMADDTWSRGANHYKVTLTRGRKRFTTYFSKGAALPLGVEAREVLSSLLSDASSIANTGGWLDWVHEMGYDLDLSVKNLTKQEAEEYGMEREWAKVQESRRTYDLINGQTDKLRDFLGEHARTFFGGGVESD